MTRLSIINNEARRVLRQMSGHRLHTMQNDLMELCRLRWEELRGRKPTAPLAQALWEVMPPAADLFVDLYGAGDLRLDDALAGANPNCGLAALVMAEIENGDLEALHIAYEAMMLFSSPAAGRVYAEAVARALRGELDGPRLHRKSSRKAPLWKALVVIASHTGRHDLKALLAVIRLLIAMDESATADKSLEQLRDELQQAGIQFVALENDLIRFNLHERPHKPISRKRFTDLLAEVRQARLG